MDSIFTKIIKGEIPSHKIYEDDKTLAFLDIHPVNPGHVLVVPKQQIADFEQLDEELYQAVMKTVYKVARHIKEVIKPPRIGLVIAGFDVPHVHIHVFPTYKGSDIPSAQDLHAEPDHEALAEVAKKLAF